MLRKLAQFNTPKKCRTCARLDARYVVCERSSISVRRGYGGLSQIPSGQRVLAGVPAWTSWAGSLVWLEARSEPVRSVGVGSVEASR